MVDFTDTGVMTESGWGGTGYDASGDFMHLPPRERRKARDRKKARQERWRKSQEVRATWSEADFARERERLAQEVAAMLAEREYRHAA